MLSGICEWLFFPIANAHYERAVSDRVIQWRFAGIIL